MLLLWACLFRFSGVSADTVRDVTYQKITRSAGVDIYGSTINYNVTYEGVTTSGQFVLQDAIVYDSTSINVDANSVFNTTNQVMQYDWLIYETTAIPSQGYADFDITLPVYMSDSARGAFLMSYTGLMTYSTTNENSANLYPFNYVYNSTYKALTQNTAVSQSASDYYGWVRLDYTYTQSGTNDYYYYRPVVYDITGGIQFLSVHFEHVRSSYDGTFSFAIACPYVYGDIQHGNASTTATTVTTASQQEINVSVNINLDDTNSKIDGIAGDVQSVKDALEGNESSYPEDFSLTVPTYPITFDDSVIDDGLTALDDVPDELAAGGFWFKLIYDILHGSPLWLLVPLLIVLALARWVIWKG